MIDRSTAWALLSQRAGPTVVLAKMYYGDESEYLPIGSGLVNLEDEDFLPLIMNMPHRFQEVDFWTREFSISDLSLEILNLPFHGDVRFSDLFDERGSGNDIGFENRQADVRLWKPGITSWDDCFDLFPVGVMRKPATQGSAAIVEVQDQTFLTLKNVELDRLTDADAADTDEGLPEKSIGKVKPRIYGNHIFSLGDDAKANDTAAAANNAVPCQPLGLDANGDNLWFVADHKVDEINNDTDDTDQQQIWGKDPDTGRMVRLKTEFTVVQNTAAGCIISVPNNAIFIDYWHGRGTVITSENESAPGRVTEFANESRVIDKIFTTASQGSLNPGAQANDSTAFVIPFPPYDNQALADAEISAIYVSWYAAATVTGGAALADGELLIGETQAVFHVLVANAADRVNSSLSNATLAEIAADINFIFNCVNALGAGESITLDVYQVYKQIEYQPRKVIDLFFTGKGAEVGADIGTGRAVVDGYDEAHADQGNSANLAENLATLIELTLRNEAGLGDSRLNLNSLNTASNTEVSSLVGAPVFLEQPDSYLQALFTLVQQYRGFFWWTPSGELFLKILEDDYTATDKVIDGNLITNLTYGRTDINQLYTAVQMLYNEIAGVNLLETPLVEDATAQTWYNVTQAQTLRKQPAHGFNNETSAIAIGNYFLANQLNIHNTVGVQLPVMFNHLDIGTLVGFENLPENLRGEDLSASYTIAGQTIRPYFLINKVDRSDEITFEAFQVHKLD